MIVNTPDRIFAALASPPRRHILAFLAQTALSTADLAERFGISAPAVSRHLSVLQRAGLVSAERQGRRVLYRLQRDALLDSLARFASEVDGPLRRAPQVVRAPREAI
ncbi:MAG: metalloregulator ArsR/SmtB family transcription factor [Betaproteobacteria bacterium]|nr:metalloregulator ArsR/SmtB family transcription factor [Betaproteobacteria bacterium]